MLARIRGLSLGAFGVLADGHLEFGPGHSEHDLHVIVGDSGTGKTTLCHALRLALYGMARSVSAATVSLPVHEATEGPAAATAAVDLETSDGRYRVERTVTEPAPGEAGEPTVGRPRVQRRDGAAWRDCDDPAADAGRLAPSETEALLLNDPGLHRAAGPAGWAPTVRSRLAAAAAARAARGDDTVSPADPWGEFRSRLEAYVDLVGPSPRHEVTTGAEPFEVRVAPDGESAGPRAGLPTGEAIRFALALTLAAGDCAGLPQWFDAPFGRLDEDARASAIDGFEAAAERRQVVLLPHDASLAAQPELTRHAATGHRLTPIDEHRAGISDLDRD